jgi:serine/threonine protein kinase
METTHVPIVGDFGLCYRADEDREGRHTQTFEAVGARKYMPPEWREGKDENPQASGDIYSLGKILYWLFVSRVYDGHEDDHVVEHPIVETSATLKNQPEASPGWTLGHSIAGDLVAQTVRKKPGDRIDSVSRLIEKVRISIDRMENDGRVLDLNLPKRCLFCASGHYQLPADIPFPQRKDRLSPPPRRTGGVFFEELRDFVSRHLGAVPTADPRVIPMFLACDVCGNVQYFRLDLTADKTGQQWNP